MLVRVDLCCVRTSFRGYGAAFPGVLIGSVSLSCFVASSLSFTAQLKMLSVVLCAWCYVVSCVPGVCVCVLCALTAVPNDFAWSHLSGVGVDVVQRHHYVHEAFPVSVRAHRACAPSRFEPCREDAAVAEFVSLGQLSEVFVVSP